MRSAGLPSYALQLTFAYILRSFGVRQILCSTSVVFYRFGFLLPCCFGIHRSSIVHPTNSLLYSPAVLLFAAQPLLYSTALVLHICPSATFCSLYRFGVPSLLPLCVSAGLVIHHALPPRLSSSLVLCCSTSLDEMLWGGCHHPDAPGGRHGWVHHTLVPPRRTRQWKQEQPVAPHDVQPHYRHRASASEGQL